MPLDSVSGQCLFDLFDEEELTAAAADLTLVALSGLIIVPFAALQASLGLEQVVRAGDGCQTPLGTSSWASRPRGGVSVVLALTEAPSLSLFSPFSAGGFFGGGAAGLDLGGDNSWTSSGDCHAIGESGRFLLLKVVKGTSKFCLGCIGSDGRQFCRSTT